MEKNIKYYLIHNLDINRKNIMMNEFEKWGFDLDNINWINHPNKDEIDDEFLNSLIIQEPSYTSGIYVEPERLRIGKGMVSCTYKHYLSLKDIVENNYEYGVIIEDNICFKGKIPDLIDIYLKQLNETYNNEWDILFDGSWTTYIENPIKDGLLVYPKTNEITFCFSGKISKTFRNKNNCLRVKMFGLFLFLKFGKV